MEHIIDFKSVDKNSLSLVGGKNASLGEMIKAGIRVPHGFAVTTGSYLNFITATEIMDNIFGALVHLDAEDIKALDKASEKIRSLIVKTAMPVDTQIAIEKGYEELSKDYHDRNIPVAVRSSATAEDLPTASFAGQQDTYLWTIGIAQVIANVKRCWASLFTSRAISYRIKNDFSHQDVLISVGIQKMVSAKTSGVMFTLDPTNGDPSKVVIEGSWGFGESVVGGYVNPDKFVVDKITKEINERTISQKHIECVYDSEKDEVVHMDVDEEMQLERCLIDDEVQELVRIARIIEDHYGGPQDIEWSIDKDISFPENLFIVQSRPETVWSQKKSMPILGGKNSYQILMERGMKRMKVEY
jgi:pyruvate,water dikinase